MANDLSPENEKFNQVQVSTGAFASRDAAIDAGIDLLRKHNGPVNSNSMIRVGSQLVARDFTERDEASLDRLGSVNSGQKPSVRSGE